MIRSVPGRNKQKKIFAGDYQNAKDRGSSRGTNRNRRGQETTHYASTAGDRLSIPQVRAVSVCNDGIFLILFVQPVPEGRLLCGACRQVAVFFDQSMTINA
jgi:hypothetical protein